MRHLKKFAAVIAAAGLALAACSGNGDDSGADNNEASGEDSAQATDFKACLVSDAGGWDDRSFNESAFNGLQQAKESLGVQAETAESSSDADFVPNVETMVANGCQQIIGVGFNLAAALKDSAEQNPDLQYGLVDAYFAEGDQNVELPNGRPLVFNTAEAAFLAGYLASGVTETGTVATFGGMQIPSVAIFMDGFVDGVKYYNEQNDKDVKVLGWDKDSQTGAFVNSFDDVSLGKQQAQQFLDQGADIIMPVAGPVGLGAASAVQDAGDALLIGVDSDWYESASDYKDIVLTSVVKEIAASVEDTVKAGAQGSFTAEPYIGTLENGGVSIAEYHDLADRVPDELDQDIKDLTEQIKSGELTIDTPNAP